ncbi:MAG TPA: hypothetical protein VNA12_09275 [Mycobacteriales bacterium]|nr:hypothetical protein [Mycobacteriales bacterium]
MNYIEMSVADGRSVRDALQVLAGGSGARGVAGVTDDGRLVALLDVPRARGDGDESPPWWADLGSLDAVRPRPDLATEVSDFVSTIPARSGFAQVIRARVTDRPTFERVLAADAEWLAVARPEVLGGALAWHGPDRFTLVVCFTDEASARAGEAKNAESPGADIDALMLDVSYAELRDPWTAPL